MLKDLIQRRIDKKYGKDFFNLELYGELEIIGKKDGEVFHYDKSHNAITVWTKHVMMHLLTGEIFSTHGNKAEQINDGGSAVDVYSGRLHPSANHSFTSSPKVNTDGTLISGEPYFTDNESYNWWMVPNPGTVFTDIGGSTAEDRDLDPSSAAEIGDDIGVFTDHTAFRYPFFPTKMLFGTGVEYDSWASIPDENKGAGEDSYEDESNGGWTESTFNDYLTTGSVAETNYYSNNWDSGAGYLKRTRTVNDVYSGVLTTDPAETDFGISGAIKDGTYTDDDQTTKIDDSSGNEFLSGSYRGIGRPCFVYVTRASRFMQDNSDIALTLGSTTETEEMESKITFSVTLPSQSGGEFYPYNGYTLKEAGLFCDARMLLGNTEPDGSASDEHEDEQENYLKMPGGIMLAKRNIYPIFKSHAVEITAKWTIYF